MHLIAYNVIVGSYSLGKFAAQHGVRAITFFERGAPRSKAKVAGLDHAARERSVFTVAGPADIFDRPSTISKNSSISDVVSFASEGRNCT
jgi:hypothetical protein